MRALLAAGMLLVAAACTSPTGQTSVATNEPSASLTPKSGTPSVAEVDATEVIVRDFTLDPIDVTVAGEAVNLAVTNEGPTVHNVAIRNDAGDLLGTTRDLRTGEADLISSQIPAGSYILFCSLPGHESLGIKGNLVVSP